MTKNLQIINIDGTEGSGKTTQILHLANHFKSKGLTVKVNYLEDSIESALECAKKTKDFLEENPEGLVINDGSIARMMVIDLVRGASHLKTLEKHRPILFEHERLDHSYGMANVLVIMDDLESCNDRLKKESVLLANTSYKTINQKIERLVTQGIRSFNNNTITQNLHFHTMEVDSEDSILEIRDSIVEYLEENFTIKKPS